MSKTTDLHAMIRDVIARGNEDMTDMGKAQSEEGYMLATEALSRQWIRLTELAGSLIRQNVTDAL